MLTLSFAQTVAPGIEWQRCLGGTLDDYGTAIRQTSDGKYIVAGFAASNNGNVTFNFGNYDYWIARLDTNGSIIWQHSYGGSGGDFASDIISTNDGGYLVTGYSGSHDNMVSGNNGFVNYWILKIDSVGTLQWQKCFGGTNNDHSFSIIQTSDGCYAVAGYVSSNDTTIAGNHGGQDYWVIKLDSVGTLLWQKCYGGTGMDQGFCIVQTSDGGYAVAGTTASNDGDVTSNNSSEDCWLIKLDSVGILQWQKCYGGNVGDYGYNVITANDGGYLLVGRANSNNGNVSGNHGISDCWIVKVDSSGTIQWQTCYGGSAADGGYAVSKTNDGGYLVAANPSSNDGNVSGNHGFYDYAIVKLDSSGNIVWQKCLGGSNNEGVGSLIQTLDGGYAIIGATYSNDGDVLDNHDITGNHSDYWIVKLYPDTSTGIKTIPSSTFNIQTIPNPFTNELTVNIPQLNSEAQLTLLDIYDKRVLTQTIPAKTSDIKLQKLTLAKGVYLLQLQNGNQTITQKVVRL